MSLPQPRRLLPATAVALAAVLVAVVADSGRAQAPGATYTITYGKTAGMLDDLRPKGIERGRVSLGDQFFAASRITRQDGVSGSMLVTYTAGDLKPVAAGRSRGLISGVYRFPDGDLFVSAGATFDDGDTDRGAITGGTGAYQGARGTVESGKAQDVIRLEP